MKNPAQRQDHENLLEKARWNFAYPWGSIINPDTNREICISENLVTFAPDGPVGFGCRYGLCQGWKTDKAGLPVATQSMWSVGAIIAKNEFRTHYGTYHFIFRVPNFRGSWPAIWLVDLTPGPPKGNGMGIPPEVDVFEHFRKDGFLTRFQITHSFHQGPTYENNTVVQQKYWRLWPLDAKYIELEFIWQADGMTWTVNGRKTMQIPGNSPKFPTRPMNLIINAGLGLDWNPRPEKFDDFIIRKASYYRDSEVL